MPQPSTYAGRTFAELKHAGRERTAAFDDDMAGKVTVGAVEPLLDAASVRAGMRVLEICCGSGYGAAGALARGAEAVGPDFAAAMVEHARRAVPGARFEAGNAEALPCPDAGFDAVLCPFGPRRRWG